MDRGRRQGCMGSMSLSFPPCTLHLPVYKKIMPDAFSHLTSDEREQGLHIDLELASGGSACMPRHILLILQKCRSDGPHDQHRPCTLLLSHCRFLITNKRKKAPIATIFERKVMMPFLLLTYEIFFSKNTKTSLRIKLTSS